MLTPRPYQIEGRDFLASRRFALLADEMRVGKTPQAILAAAAIKPTISLVVCPAIAVPQWRREIERWYPADQVGEWEVVSYDRFRINSKDYLSPRWSVAIVDECHFAKNPEAQRTKLVYGKGGLGWCSDKLWVLSGTPAPKHAGELWPMLYAFGVVGLSYDDFIHRYCRVDGLGIIRGTKESMIPELRGLLAKIMLRRTRKEVAPDMPAIDYQFLEIPRSQADFGIPAGLSDDDLAAWLEAHPTAAQDDRIAVAISKVGPLADQIEFAVGNGLLKQTVVFGWHVEPLTALSNRLNSAGIRAAVLNGATSPKQREVIQRQFREGFLQVICGNILACGTAIDLSSARHGYMLEMDWVPGNNVQAVNRLVSLDKMDKVTIDCITMPGSADDRVQGVLMRRVKELSQLY